MSNGFAQCFFSNDAVGMKKQRSTTLAHGYRSGATSELTHKYVTHVNQQKTPSFLLIDMSQKRIPIKYTKNCAAGRHRPSLQKKKKKLKIRRRDRFHFRIKIGVLSFEFFRNGSVSRSIHGLKGDCGNFFAHQGLSWCTFWGPTLRGHRNFN